VRAPRILVIGGANTDIVGLPDGRFTPRDSNPGHIRISGGGVARNIAENLARLGAEVEFVTAFGTDDRSLWLRQECESVGIGTRHSVITNDVPGSRYLAVMDSNGDLAAAINDMRALESVTPEAIERAPFGSVDAVVLDTNLPGSTIAHAAELAGDVPVILDPVSTAKGPLARPVLSRLAALKCNLREAEEISGAAGAEGAAERLLEAGVRWVFVTMGADGVWCASADERFGLPAPPARVVNATGAGDAFAAGIAFACATGMDLRTAAARASALSAMALESERTVSEAISAAALDAWMEEHA